MFLTDLYAWQKESYSLRRQVYLIVRQYLRIVSRQIKQTIVRISNETVRVNYIFSLGLNHIRQQTKISEIIKRYVYEFRGRVNSPVHSDP